jgi:hypothetical protein
LLLLLVMVVEQADKARKEDAHAATDKAVTLQAM